MDCDAVFFCFTLMSMRLKVIDYQAGGGPCHGWTTKGVQSVLLLLHIVSGAEQASKQLKTCEPHVVHTGVVVGGCSDIGHLVQDASCSLEQSPRA